MLGAAKPQSTTASLDALHCELAGSWGQTEIGDVAGGSCAHGALLLSSSHAWARNSYALAVGPGGGCTSMDSPGQPVATPAPDAGALEEHLELIQKSFAEWDTRAYRRAKFRRLFGIAAAVAGPLAATTLVWQVVAIPEGGPIAFGLILFELLVLFGLLLIAFADLGPSQDTWMRDRVRAEALRRERFLVLARVGPYLTSPDPCAVIQERIAFIVDEVTEPEALILLEEPGGALWRDALEEAGTGATADPDPRCVDEFFQQRVSEQEQWYLRKSRAHEWGFRLIEMFARLALVLALIVSAIHLASLYWVGDRHGADRPWELLAVELAALFLPNLGAAAISLHIFLESRRLARTYHSQARRLQRLRGDLAALRTQSPSPDNQHRLKRVVLQTEGLLAEELHQWWLHAYR